MKLFKPNSFFTRLVAGLLIPAHLALVRADTVGVGGTTETGPVQESFVPDFVQPPPMPSPPPPLAPPGPVLPSVQPPEADDLPAQPTLADFQAAVVFEDLISPSGTTSPTPQEAADFRGLLLAYEAAGGNSAESNGELLAAFLSNHPETPFRLNVLIERARLLHAHGWFEQCLAAWRQAWDFGKGMEGGGIRRLADAALGELITLESRLGHAAELRGLLAEIAGRKIGGLAKARADRAAELLWFIENRAEQNILCGFTALNKVCVPLGHAPVFPDVHDEAEKDLFISRGVSAFDLKEHSAEAGGGLRIIRRTSPDAPAPVPAVVHWDFGHFSALTERDENGRVHLSDEHLDFDGWISSAALGAQASGVFLIPATQTVPAGYAELSDAEGGEILGRHCMHGRSEWDAARSSAGGDAADCAMATYSFSLLDAGLMVQDTPVSYTPPRGYPIVVRLTYDQRNTATDDAPATANFGPRWRHSYQTYVRKGVFGWSTAEVISGTAENLRYDNPEDGVYEPPRLDLAELKRLESGTFVLTNRDGSSITFAQPNTASSPSRYYLTAMTDSFGNTVSVSYGSGNRINKITDAIGQETTFGYPATGDTSKITSITDPFQRAATFTYTADGQLESITDPMNIVSSFEYGNGDVITAVTTPYGRTSFTAGEESEQVPGLASNKVWFIESLDPKGDRERMESVNLASLPFTEALAPTSVTVGGTGVSFLPKNDNLFYRNTFHWDRKQMHDHGADYSKARIYNWLAVGGDKVIGIPASVKEPLEGRVWFNYPGQTNSSAPGNVSSMPSKTVRQVEGPAGTPTWVMSQAKYDNPYGLPTGSVDEKGRETRLTYHAGDLDVHLVQVKDGTNWRTLKSFDSYENHAPTQITDASGVVTTIDYNLQGQVLSTSVTKPGTTPATPVLTTRYTYSDDVNSDSETDGYLIKVEQTDPDNASAFVEVASYTYETTGAKRVKTATDAHGYTITYTSYDHFDRPLVITHPDNSTEQFVHDKLDLVATKARDGTWSRARYDHLRRLVLSQDSLGRTSSYDWCRCGQLKSLTDPLNRTTRYVRDIEGRVLEKVLPDESTFVYQYQAQSGRLANLRMPKDAAATQPTVAYSYDLDSRLLTQDYTDANTPDVSFAFADYLGRLTSHTDQLGTTNYAYHPLDGSTNGAGELASVDGPWADDTVFYEFDAYGRPKKQQIKNDTAPNAATHSVEMAYDALSRVTSIVNPLGTFNHAYSDVSDRVQSITTTAGGGFSQTFAYHPLTTPGAGGDMASMTHQVGSTTVSAFSYGFDAGSRLRTLTEQLGPNPTTDTRQWAYDYTKEDELTDAVLTQPPGGSVQQRRSWQHDTAGNRARDTLGTTSKLAWHNTRNQITQIGGGGMSLVEGTLDELGTVTVKVNSSTHQPARMMSLPGGGARFQKEAEFQVGTNTIEVKATDASANLTTQNYTVEVDAISDTFTHDTNGNLETHISGGVTKRYEWDAKNRLLAVQSADPPVNGTTRTEFEYDGLDRRVRTIEKTHDGTAWTTQSNVTWQWCGDDICQQRDSTGATPTRSYYSEGMMVGATPYLQTTDHLGSPRELLDGATGALVARYDYDPWGTRTKLTGSGVDTDFGFTGHLLHTVSGLILAKHRAYSASLGRWISADPIGEEDDLNLYRYVGGSPTMDVDMLGLRSWGREALGFVPVIGSALDAYDAARCGHYWTAAFHGVLALADLGGIGAGTKLIGRALLKRLAKSKLPSGIARNFAGGRATRIVLTEPLTLTRFHGGKAGRVGRWMSGDKFSSRRVVRQRLALKQEWGNGISKATSVELPKGTTIWRGTAAPQLQKNGRTLRGGGDQIWVEGNLDPSWFTNTVHF